MKLSQTTNYLLLNDEEAEIKEGDYLYNSDYQKVVKTDVEYIRSLNSNKTLCSICNKIIAYYPLTKEAKELDLPLLPNPFKRLGYSDLEAEKLGQEYTMSIFGELDDFTDITEGFKAGYKAAQSKGQYSLEDIKKAILMAKTGYDEFTDNGFLQHTHQYSMSEIIQSLSTQQTYPKSFIPEYEKDCPYDFTSRCTMDRCDCKIQIKTITNSEGKKEIQGSYKY